MNTMTSATESLLWNTEWERARQRYEAWWNQQGLVLHIRAPKDEPWQPLEEPGKPDDVETVWTDPVYRFQRAEYDLANTYFGAEAIPYFDTQIGPGSLGLFLGCEPGFEPSTVWYEPSISDPEQDPPLRFDPTNRWFKVHEALIDIGVERANGRFLVGVPDLIENIDVLSQLRGPQTLMMDLIERPEWVEQRLRETHVAYVAAFDAIYDKIKDDHGGNAFSAFGIWGAGRTAKVQCDAAAMFSPDMFRRFVVPTLTEQCEWLDYSMFHLDGEDCICQLDALLEIDALNAIEWTPVLCWSGEGGGHPKWYDFYKRILAGGKSVQAIQVMPDEVIPLLDAVGPKGMYISTYADSETEARDLVERVEAYR